MEFNSFKKKPMPSKLSSHNSINSQNEDREPSVQTVISEIDNMNQETNQISKSNIKSEKLFSYTKKREVWKTPEKGSEKKQNLVKKSNLDFDEKPLKPGHFISKKAQYYDKVSFQSCRNQE